MKFKINRLFCLSFSLLILSLSGCGNPNSTNQTTVDNYNTSQDTQPATPNANPTQQAEPSPIPTQAKLNANTSNPKTTKAVLYSMDAQCQNLVPEESQIQAEEPVNDAVGKILAKNDSGDFSISKYRVNIQNGVATIDLRVSPNSKRQIASLSSCENSAIFGSLRKTLTANSQWQIKDVRFTEQGEEIVF